MGFNDRNVRVGADAVFRGVGVFEEVVFRTAHTGVESDMDVEGS